MPLGADKGVDDAPKRPDPPFTPGAPNVDVAGVVVVVVFPNNPDDTG